MCDLLGGMVLQRHQPEAAVFIAERDVTVVRRPLGIVPEGLPSAGDLLGGRRAVLRHYVDRKSTRLNSSHLVISYAVFCLKKKIRSVIRSRANPASELTVPAPATPGARARTSQGPIAVFFFNKTATTEIYTLSPHAPLPI